MSDGRQNFISTQGVTMDTSVNEFLTFFRSLDSKERDSLFEKIKEEYTEIKEMEAAGFIPAEQKYGIEMEQSSTNSFAAKMKQRIEAIRTEIFHKDTLDSNLNTPKITNHKKVFSQNPKPTQETRKKLQAKMCEVASKDKEANHTKDKGAER